MIVKVENGEIKAVKFGDIHPSKGEFFVPKNWGTEEVVDFYCKNKSIKNCINEVNPEEPFDLLKIS